MNGGRRGKKTLNSNDEVEMLLRATEDELLLNLSVDSHMSNVSPSYLDSDLDRRFQTLKSSPAKRSPAPATVSKAQTSQPLPTTATGTDNKKRDDSSITYDDLLSRFANLKGSAPVPASVSSSADLNCKTNGSDEDEVEKVIQWAIDAARLDPSPPSDSEDEDDNEEIVTDEEDTDEDDIKKKKINSKGKKKIQR
ncbi:nucleolin [Impatiens glandulifera]|uniref:nucleolin n=1 Tax=Impatiens glandulifera TaxID=253017 RepID=UPI001FB18A5C|nr:nucleolin [Impatiens glandulifera]